MPEVREGMLKGGLPCLSFGEGPPLMVFPGFGMTNANPTGVQRWGEVRLLAPLARAFTVHRVGRKVGLEPGTTVADLAESYAGALEDGFGPPVDVLGISTGGSIALQLAADRPGLVRRLVVAGAAYRLSEHGRVFQRRAAELAAAGDRRELSRMQAPDVADSRLGRRIVGGLLWLAGPLFIRRSWDPSDMIATIRAEDDFDIKDRLLEIPAPTLVLGGGRDRFYPPELFRETAERIPDARLVLYQDRARGHLRRPTLRQGRRRLPEGLASGAAALRQTVPRSTERHPPSDSTGPMGKELGPPLFTGVAVHETAMLRGP